jgi:uncharacterized protein YkwD
MIRPARILPLLFALLIGACAGMPPSAPSLDRQLEAVKSRLFVLVQEQRRELNAQAHLLAHDPQLAAAAQLHSDDMAKKNSFDEMNPDGNPAVNALLADPKFRGFVGENSAAQYFIPGTELDTEAVAHAFLQIWLNSPNHAYNLSYASFDRAGIGVTVTGNTIYAAELFATDLGLPEP